MQDSVGGSPFIRQTSDSMPLLSFMSHAIKNTASVSPACVDGCPHGNCIVAAIRGARQGLYYGGKVRFAHSLVM